MDEPIQNLPSEILFTGSKFIITDSTVDGALGPGTTGIVNYVVGVDTGCSNVVYLSVVILKRGKTGKSRLDVDTISTPVFCFKNMNLSNIMPDEKRKRYVYIKPETLLQHTINEIEDLDYLGWALSRTCYLKRLSQYLGNGGKLFCIWPLKNSNIMNKMLNAGSYWKEDRESAINELCCIEARRTFVEQMRVMEATLARCSITYMLKVAEIETLAVEYLIKHSDKTSICDCKVLDATHKHFTKKYTNLKSLKKTIAERKKM